MNDCDRILQQLNAYLDGANDVDVRALHQQAATDSDCLAVFETLLQIHELFTDAPMVSSNLDFATSVTKELTRLARRQRLALAGVVLLGILTFLLPLLSLVWIGAAILLEPSWLSQLITTTLTFISDIAAMFMAIFTAMNQLPPVARLSLFTILAISLLILALASANRAHPELVHSPTTS